MTGTSRPSPYRHARRLGIAVVCAGALAMSGTSTLVFADGTRPAESAAATSVVGLREGDSGPAVQAVQQKLIGFGYYVAGGADGHFGPGTTAALRVFQKQNGLNPTGVVTENTAKYLGLAGGVPASGTQATPQPAAPAAPAALAAPSGSVVGLRKGMTGATVRQLQLAILATGLYLSGGADGTFGTSTHRAVTLVQRVNGLPETGVVDAATASALGLTGSASSPSTPAPAGTVVQLGATGAAVKRVQQLLIKAGINVVGGADGVFGPQTRRAVTSFQGLHGLPQTGSVDPATDAALVKASGGAAAAPSTSSYVGLRVGSTGPAVTKLQQAIIATGLVVRGGADGIFGQHTRTAVLVYQRVNGLQQTGIVDEATARLLGLLTPRTVGGGSAPAAVAVPPLPASRRMTSGAAAWWRSAASVAEGRHQLLRRRRRDLRLGDGWCSHEVPAGARSACHGQGRPGDGRCPRPAAHCRRRRRLRRSMSRCRPGRSAKDHAGMATPGRRHGAADGSTSASTSAHPKELPCGPSPPAASLRSTAIVRVHWRATV